MWRRARQRRLSHEPGDAAAASAIAARATDGNTKKRLKTLLKDIAATPGQAREHHDVTILLSLPGVGVRIAAAMLAEGTGPLGQRDYYALRTMSGLAPVTRASGKSRQVTMRYACHLRLRTACYHMARTALQRDAHVKAHYAALRRKGAQPSPRAAGRGRSSPQSSRCSRRARCMTPAADAHWPTRLDQRVGSSNLSTPGRAPWSAVFPARRAGGRSRSTYTQLETALVSRRRSPRLLSLRFLDDPHARARADACRAGGDHRLECLEVAARRRRLSRPCRRRRRGA